MLLRRVIGDALRSRRQNQHRTLREVSTAANVSLGYLSEIERGQKEASSELLAAICEALGSELSDVLRDATASLAHAERTAAPVLAEAASEPAPEEAPALQPAGSEPQSTLVSDRTVAVTVRRDGPLRTTLHAVRGRRPGGARTGELTRPLG